ncbi:MAG: CCA tRNA nucleotidyltransferase [Rhizobiaceae bacterium]
MTIPARLSDAQSAFLREEGLMKVMKLIEDAGGEVRVNGGAVRNSLLGEPVRDVDLSTTLLPDHVTDCLQRGGIKVVPTGREHGTVTAVAEGRGIEVTTLRMDVETDGRRAVVRFGTDWAEDAKRRDLTMNALYCDRQGRLFDPLEVHDDLVNRRVRFIGDADQRIAEDHLRILRFFRFFAWYGNGRPDAEGLKACARARETISSLSAERVWMELKKLLEAGDPSRALLWMRTSGVLQAVLPESEKWGIDAFPALVAAERSQQLRSDALLRLMAMLPPVPTAVSALCARMRLSGAEAERLNAWAGAALPGADLKGPDLEKHLYRAGLRPSLDKLLIELARLQTYDGEADLITARVSQYREGAKWQRPQFPVSGRDLIEQGHAAGKGMGEILSRLEQAWIESGFTLPKSDLLKLASEA